MHERIHYSMKCFCMLYIYIHIYTCILVFKVLKEKYLGFFLDMGIFWFKGGSSCKGYYFVTLIKMIYVLIHKTFIVHLLFEGSTVCSCCWLTGVLVIVSCFAKQWWLQSYLLYYHENRKRKKAFVSKIMNSMNWSHLTEMNSIFLFYPFFHQIFFFLMQELF